MSEKKNEKEVAKATENTPAVAEKTNAQRFTERIMSEFKGSVGEVGLTEFQKKLIQNYFIHIDLALKSAEEKRLKKSGQYQETLSYEWKNVALESLAVRVVALSKIGLDPLQPNHLNAIPYRNNTTNKYDVSFLLGYRGLEVRAKKYGLDVPNAVNVELVYENDVFTALKKDSTNNVESYKFDIPQPFNRGKIIGGFYYHDFHKEPHKNKLMMFSLAEIEKRKPKYASTEFWGGQKDIFKDGKKTGEKETIEGWHAEMCWKTLYRAAYNNITIDSAKIDNDYQVSVESENVVENIDHVELNSQAMIAEKANVEEIKFAEAVEVKEPIVEPVKVEAAPLGGIPPQQKELF